MKALFFMNIILISLTPILSSIEYYPACDSSFTSLVDALRSIGVDSSFSNRKNIAILNGISDYSGTAAQNTQLLNLLKQGKLIKSNSGGDDPIPPSSSMIEKVANHPKFSSKKDTLKIIGNVLVDNGYPTSFIAGVLGNIFHEGKIGKFESSAYISHPELEPQYLIYMDQLYDYRNKYSNKIITQVSMNALTKILEELKKNNWKKGKFGLGCIQWTGSRTYNLFKIYQKESNYRDIITLAQATAAEGKMVISELRGDYNYVYNQWDNNNPDKNTATAAYNAGHILCMKYEIPADTEKKAKQRGNTAQEMYIIMTG